VYNWREELLFLKEQRFYYATRNLIVVGIAAVFLKIILKKILNKIKKKF
jgi:hypothetical protein